MRLYPDYFKSKKATNLRRDGMRTYQRGKRNYNYDMMEKGELMIRAGGGTVRRCEAPNTSYWRFMPKWVKQIFIDRVEIAETKLAHLNIKV